MMISGVFVQSILTTFFISMLFNPTRLKFETRMKKIKKLQRHKNVPNETRKMIQDFYQIAWGKYHGVPSLTSLYNHIPDSIRNSINLELCNRAFGSHGFFMNFSQSQLLIIIEQMEEISAAPQDVLCSQYQMGSYFLVIISGYVRVEVFGSLSIQQNESLYGVTNLFHPGSSQFKAAALEFC
jgi:hypothetical protein